MSSKWFYYNLVDQDSTDITASSEDAFFPASNIKHPFQNKVYRSVSGTPTANVLFDFKTTEEVDSILIRFNNFDGIGFTGNLTIEANATANFSSPAFTDTIEVDEKHNLGIKILSASQNYRYWRIVGTGTLYLELSNVFIGKKMELVNDLELGWTYNNKDTSKVSRNRYGQRFIDKINKVKRLSGSYKLLEKDEAEQLMVLWDYCGVHTPIWLVMDTEEAVSSEKERFAGMFYLLTMPTISNPHYALYNAGVSLEEAI